MFLQEKLIGAPVVQWPNGISVDFVSDRIYWVDARTDYIASANLDGSDMKKILEKTVGNILIHPPSLK